MKNILTKEKDRFLIELPSLLSSYDADRCLGMVGHSKGTMTHSLMAFIITINKCDTQNRNDTRLNGKALLC
jgi:hypothetical protein